MIGKMTGSLPAQCESGNWPVTADFTRALPKIELHAHLSGSISRQCLHEIWLQRRESDRTFDLPDPLIEMPLDKVDYDIKTFFPLFSTYIYRLCSNIDSIRYSTRSVLQAFEDDGVVYLELRTTPRAIPSERISKDLYVSTILDMIHDFSISSPSQPSSKSHTDLTSDPHSELDGRTYLILSIDRRNTPVEAMEVVELAIKYQTYRTHAAVVGIDLCGDPSKGDVSTFREAFAKAKAHGLKTTVHFAETPASSSLTELETLLSFEPNRLGHVIHVPQDLQEEIARRGLGVELCLSCNVHAKMIEDGFASHHFGYWRNKSRHISLCTDDWGIFGSSPSNEHLLAARHFDLSQEDLVELSFNATSDIFAPRKVRQMLRAEIRGFGKGVGWGGWLWAVRGKGLAGRESLEDMDRQEV